MPGINPNPQRQREAQSKGIKNYTLVGNKGFLTIFKWEMCAILAMWNGYLFIQTIRGAMGVLTAIVAISLEGMALYCVHNYTRSVGSHKKWLGRFAVLLGSFSLIHSVVAIVEHTGYARQYPGVMWWLTLYSNVLALPFIIILLACAIATLTMKHWSAAVMDELSFIELESQRDQARMLMEERKILGARALTELKAEVFEEETSLALQLIPVIKRRIDASKEVEAMIEDIEDPDLRRQIRRDIDALTSRLPATSPASTVLPSRPSTPSQVGPHARQSILGLDHGNGYPANGGGYNGHP